MLHEHEDVTSFLDPSEYVASQVNCADCPLVSDITPEIAMEVSVGLGGGADLVYALQQKFAEPFQLVKSDHDEPFELRKLCPDAAVASLV